MKFNWKILPFIALLIWSTSLQAQSAQYGDAAYYSDDLHGRATASGELYDYNKLTCAHKTLPLGSIIKVTRVDNGRSVRVRVNDCGPHTKGRIVDLSRAAAEKINLVWDGVTRVRIDVISRGKGKSPCEMAGQPVPTSFSQDGSRLTIRGGEPSIGVTSANGLVSPSTVGTYPLSALRPMIGGFAVQVASFIQFENTATKAEEMESKGFKNVLINTDGVNYRVLLGPFDSKASAEGYQKNLDSKYKIKGFVVDLANY